MCWLGLAAQRVCQTRSISCGTSKGRHTTLERADLPAEVTGSLGLCQTTRQRCRNDPRADRQPFCRGGVLLDGRWSAAREPCRQKPRRAAPVHCVMTPPAAPMGSCADAGSGMPAPCVNTELYLFPVSRAITLLSDSRFLSSRLLPQHAPDPSTVLWRRSVPQNSASIGIAACRRAKPRLPNEPGGVSMLRLEDCHGGRGGGRAEKLTVLAPPPASVRRKPVVLGLELADLQHPGGVSARCYRIGTGTRSGPQAENDSTQVAQ